MSEIKDVTKIKCDIFFSAFDGCERTSRPFELLSAQEKYWLVFPQYRFREEELPERFLTSNQLMESDYIAEVLAGIDLVGKSICIDATGFLIPHLVFFIQFLKRRGIRQFDIIYSEPANYKKAEDTEFTRSVNMPRVIEGYSASARIVNGDDALIIFSGFNDALVTAVARNKSKAKHKYIFMGFPSLQADMYQQNLIQFDKSSESIGETCVYYRMAPAYDPFVAADKLQAIVEELMQEKYNTEFIHIAPLSTKPMAIASALVYMNNPNCPIDLVYPPSETYIGGHAIGIKRTWKYTIEL